jgi:hypothetical protein
VPSVAPAAESLGGRRGHFAGGFIMAEKRQV